MAENCWGCGQDYLQDWVEDDLAIIRIYGELEYICPDCFDELPEDYDTGGVNRV